MNTVPQAAAEQPMPSPARRETVVMGRGDFLSVVMRLIGLELYKIRRRAMSTVLCAIAIPIIVISFAAILLISLTVSASPAESFLPPQCASVGGTQPCLNHEPTAADLARAERAKQAAVQEASAPLRLPDSIETATTIIQFIGLVLITVLAGTIVGSEYGVGTIRLMFTRGPTRSQFLLSKVGAVLVCISIGVLGSVIIGVVTGALLNLATHIDFNFSFFTGVWLLHLVLYLLVAMLGLFMYAMIALCLATLGRATAAGVAGTFVWWVLEGILGRVLGVLGAQMGGVAGDILKSVPDYFIGNNVSALLQNQSHYVVSGNGPAELSDLHALLVLAAYLVLLIGLAWWASTSRDVTN